MSAPADILDGLRPLTVEKLARLEGMPAPVAALALDALRPGSREVLIQYGVAEERSQADGGRIHLVVTQLGSQVISLAADRLRRMGNAPPYGQETRAAIDSEIDSFLAELESAPLAPVEAPIPGPTTTRDAVSPGLRVSEASPGSRDGDTRRLVLISTLADQVTQSQRELNESVLGGCCFATLLKASGPLSIADLVDHTGFSETTVSQATTKLVDRGFVSSALPPTERDQGDEERFRIDIDQHCVLGVSVQTDQIVGIVSTLEGDIRYTKREPLSATRARSPKAVATDIARFVEQLLDDCPAHGISKNPIGLGVDVAGHVDPNTGEVIYAPRLDWRNVAFGDLLEKATGLKVFVENDVNALAIHEQWFGEGVDVKCFGVVYIGEGVGAGFVLDGTLCHGAFGLAGELGHIVVERNGRPCWCGGKGHLESYASTQAILATMIGEGADIGLDLEAAAAMAEKGSYSARNAFTGAGEALGHGIATLLTLTNLAVLVVTGPSCLVTSEGRAGRLFRRAVLDTAGDLSFDNAFNECALLWRALPQEFGPHGAASTVLRYFLERPLAWDARVPSRSNATK